MPAKGHAAAKGTKSARTYKGRPVDLVVDVRSKVEFWLGHLDGATCIPLTDLAMRLSERTDVDPDTRIMLYCASGARSAAAATQLRAMGYRHVTDAGAMSQAFHDYKP